jgi:N-acetylneuraminic acid mutarotase
MRASVLFLPALVAVAAVPTLRWSEGRPMPVAKAGAAAAILGEKLVLAGGTYWEAGQKHWSTRVDVYNIPSDEWQLGPALPKPLSYGAFVRSKHGLEVLGGSDGKRVYRECWTLGKGLAKWLPTGTLPENRVYGRAEILDGKLYLLGGSTDAADFSHATDTVLAADESSRSNWKALAAIPGGPRALHASAAAGGRLYVFGGCRNDAQGELLNLADAYSYAPKVDRWNRVADLPQPVRSLSAAAVGDRFVYLFGGYTATPAETRSKPLDFGFSPAVYVYDIEANRYEKAASMPLPVSDIDFVLHGAALYGAGGEDRNYGRSRRTLIARFAP